MMKYLLFSLLFFSINAQAQTFGNWAVASDGKDFKIATTANADSYMHVGCYTGSDKCNVILQFPGGCDIGERYPVMINSKGGASVSYTICAEGSGNSKRGLVIDDLSAVISAAKGGQEIGFAVPMASGKFMVQRFSTVGAFDALQELFKAPEAKNSKAQYL